MKDYTAIMSKLGGYQWPDRLPKGIEAVREFERDKGIELPPDYRDFVSVWGISTFKGYVAFPIRGNPPFGHEGLMGVFLGFRPGDGYHLPDEVELYNGRIPDELIPVAEDPGSSMICLGITGQEFDHVFYWDKESEGQPDAVWPIADSWDEFMHVLKPWKRPT